MTVSGDRYRFAGLLLALILLVMASLPGLISRSIWHDEAITLLETASGPLPWPGAPVPAGELKPAFEGRNTTAGIVRVLRDTDIHPPVYYWGLSWWRQMFGSSVVAARTLSLAATATSVLLLFLLLRAAGTANPFPAVLIFACSTFTVHLSHEARNYAFGTMLLLIATLLAWIAVRDGRSPVPVRSHALAALAGLAAGAAFLTGYLSVFWVSCLAIWFSVCVWRRSARLAAVLPAVAAASGIGGFLAMGLAAQFSAPGTRQDRGFDGIVAELTGTASSLLDLVANHEGYWGRRAVAILLVSLAALTAWRFLRGRVRPAGWDPRILALFVAVAAASVLGVIVLDLVQGKHLYRATRYFAYTLPALAVLLAHGAASLPSAATRTAGAALVGALAVLQLASVNWGDERCRGGTRMGRPHRSVAEAIAASPREPLLVLIGTGPGRGDPWSYVYELDDDVPVWFVHWNTDPDEAVRLAGSHEEVWLLRSFEGATTAKEREVWDALLQSALFQDDPPGLDRRVLRASRVQDSPGP